MPWGDPEEGISISKIWAFAEGIKGDQPQPLKREDTIICFYMNFATPYNSDCMKRWYNSILNLVCLCSLIAWSFAVFSGAGCSTRALIKEGRSGKEWICDEAADEAMKQENYQAGIFLHQRLIEKEPKNALAIYHLGYAHGQTGNHEQEVSYYEKAVSLGYEEESLFFNMGMAFGELNQIDKSIDAFKKALDINPENADSHFGLAMIYQKSAVDGLAEKEFLETIRITPRHLEARLFLSLLYADLGEMQKAKEQLREILKIDPDHERARVFLEKIEKE